MTINHKEILNHFSQCGMTGQQLSNYLAWELNYTEPQEVLHALRLLEKNGYLKVRGRRTLEDLGALVEEKSAQFVTLDQQKKVTYGHETNHGILFNPDSSGFFETHVSITLSGRFALACGLSLKRQPAPLPPDALQKLHAKCQAEKQGKKRGWLKFPKK